MISKHSLRSTLFLLLAACLMVVAAIQIAVRYSIELPRLYAQEYANDVSAVHQLQRAFELEAARKNDVLIDNGHWIRAHQFMELERGSAAYARFVDEEFTHVETMHRVPRVDGYIYFDSEGGMFFESTADPYTLLPGASLPLSLDDLKVHLSGNTGALSGGFIDSAIGPVFFGVTSITDDDAVLEPNGYLVVWRHADDAFFGELAGSDGVSFDRLGASERGDLVAAIRATAEDVLPRSTDDSVRWLIDDINGEPLFQVRQTVPPRTFRTGLVTVADIAALCVLSVALTLFGLLLSRRVISPILELGAFAKSVAESEDYSRRIPVKHGDEVGNVAQRFDELLVRVESQEQTLKTQNRALEALSERDSLTNVYNRRAFERILGRDWSQAMRSQIPLNCIMIDIDFFKSYNDHYGHQAGDEVLQAVAGALVKEMNRLTDTICRYGGEEFVALMVDTSHQAAIAIAEKMVGAVERLKLPHAFSDCAACVTVSAGVATIIPRKDDLASTLVRAADQALYQAKEHGRNQICASYVDYRGSHSA